MSREFSATFYAVFLVILLTVINVTSSKALPLGISMDKINCMALKSEIEYNRIMINVTTEEMQESLKAYQKATRKGQEAFDTWDHTVKKLSNAMFVASEPLPDMLTHNLQNITDELFDILDTTDFIIRQHNSSDSIEKTCHEHDLTLDANNNVTQAFGTLYNFLNLNKAHINEMSQKLGLNIESQGMPKIEDENIDLQVLEIKTFGQCSELLKYMTNFFDFIAGVDCPGN